MGCDCGKPKCDGHCGVSPAVLQINNPSECVLFHRVEVPASMGDSKTNPPKSGAYKNVLLFYEADQTSWLYSSDGVPQKLVSGLTDYEDAINLPQINGVTLLGNKNSADLKLADAPMVIAIASGNAAWSGADTAEDIYNFFLNQGKVNVIFEGSENYGYEIVSAAYIPGEQKMMCMTTVASLDTGSSPVEFTNSALYGLMTFYTVDKAVDVGELDLQPKLFITDFTGLSMIDGNVLEGVPATNASIGMVKPGDGLSVSSDGTLNAPYKERMDENYRVSKVNGAKANSLFPDVTKFSGKYYMVFRTGTLHASFDGEIALCESEDGINWSAPISILATAGVDYRDPFLSVLDNKLYLSCFTRVDNGDNTVTLTGYIYTLAPATGTTAVARTIANEAIFGKIINANGSILFGSYNSSGCYIYRGADIANATVAKTFLSGYELTLRYFNNKYYLLTRDSSGISLSESTDLSTWTAISIPQMTAADSFTKIGDKYLIGYRDSIIDKHEYGNFAIAVFDDAFNVVDIYKVFPSQTQDCGYSAIYYDEEEAQIVVATYLQDGASVSSVYIVLIKGADVTPLAILRNRFDLDNCLKPATLSNERDYASVIELVDKVDHGKFINMLSKDGTVRCQIYKDPNSNIVLIDNPNGGIRVKGTSNLIMGVNNYSNIELQGTGDVLMRQNLEVRGTANTWNLKVRAKNVSTSPYVDVIRFSSGAYDSIPALADVPTGYMYWDTTNARLLINAGGVWKEVTLTSI